MAAEQYSRVIADSDEDRFRLISHHQTAMLQRLVGTLEDFNQNSILSSGKILATESVHRGQGWIHNEQVEASDKYKFGKVGRIL
ncbi:hypothetical protein AAHC03_016436 [Spirometra sp. Aus1]